MTDNDDKIISCWNSIGVWGSDTPRCRLLQEVVHCRNCETYIRAGKNVLERPPPEGYLEQWTRQLARSRETRHLGEENLLVFRISREWLGMPCKYLDEVCEQKRIRTLPSVTSKFIKGLVNISGRVQLCFSLGQVLHFDKQPEDRKRGKSLFDALLVNVWDGRRYVFPVNEVLGIFSYMPQNLKPVPDTLGDSGREYITGIVPIQGRDVGRVDAERVFQAFDRGST